MNLQQEQTVQCPYCWEKITVLVDTSLRSQEYVEDCQVCCRPILLTVHCDDQDIEIHAARENE